MANRRLVEVSDRLAARLPGLRLLDARRARLGGEDEPLTTGQVSPGASARWAAPIALATGMSAMLALAD